MRVGILYNPLSGKGKAKLQANRLAAHLEQLRYEVKVGEAVRLFRLGTIKKFIEANQAIVVAGGDGTLMPMLDLLADAKTPVYMLPAGNESLFAKAFEFSSKPEKLQASLDGGRIEQHYYGHVGKTPFFHMVSVGLDSLVVHDVNRKRKGPIGNIGYLLPTVIRGVLYRAPKISLLVDGTQVLNQRSGSLIVANHRTYAGMIAPVPEADSREPLLYARFFPNMGRLGYLNWGLAFALRRKVNVKHSLLFKGREFELDVLSRSAYPIQADGEYVGDAPKVIRISRGTICTYS